jgi:uncharacterized protein YdaU (DUF1376 family)
VNYFPFHLGDYAAHTAHLEPMEDLAYRRMLDLYYRTERPLPREVSEIARLIRLKGHEDAINAVIGEFFDDCTDGWMHERCDAEIQRMQDKQAKARASAQASVNARAANAERTLNERSTSVELPTPTPTPTPGKNKARAAPGLLPEWVPVEPWQHFVEHRKAMRGVPFTDAARDGVLRELSRLRDMGHDPAALLQTSVTRGWRTVFEPKGQAPPASKQSALESRNAATVKRLLAEDHAAQ